MMRRLARSFANPKPSPYNIKEDFKLLGPNKHSTEASIQKKLIEGNYCYFKLTFDDTDKCLGHRIGQAVQLAHKSSDKLNWRYYTPLSRLDEQGSADFLVKLVDSPNHSIGEFSRLLRNSKDGDKMLVKGPIQNWLYEGFGKLSIADYPVKDFRRVIEPDKPAPYTSYSFETLVLFAHDNAITAYFNLIDTIASFPEDRTKLVLIYFVDSYEDLVLEQELLYLQESGRVHVKVVQKSCGHSPGQIDQLKQEFADIIQTSIPSYNEKTAFFICGKTAFCHQITSALEILPQTKDNRSNFFII